MPIEGHPVLPNKKKHRLNLSSVPYSEVSTNLGNFSEGVYGISLLMKKKCIVKSRKTGVKGAFQSILGYFKNPYMYTLPKNI